MNAYPTALQTVAKLFSTLQAKPSSITSDWAFAPHLHTISKSYQGNHQNWNDGGFTNHH